MFAPIRSALAFLCRQVRPGLSGASVLCYHSIGDNGAPFTVSKQVFESHIAYIVTHHTVVTPSELICKLKNRESLAGCVCITFDDGYADNLTTVLPILEKHKVRAGVFVITSRIGKTNTHSNGIELPIMNEEQLKEAYLRGMEILPHTHTHRDTRDVTAEEFEIEFEGSRALLGQILGTDIPRIIAYPKGRSHEAAHAWLLQRGWHAFGTRGGIVCARSLSHDIERNGIRATTTWSEFRTKLSNGVVLFERLRALSA